MNMDPSTEDEPRSVNPFVLPTEERGPSIEFPEHGKAQAYTGSMPLYQGVRADALAPGAQFAPMVLRSTGLQWRFAPGQELQDIGRSFTSPDTLEDMHEVDLRTILAHLDAAARGVMRELEARGLGGRAAGR